ncbi:exodeoxyribonuclease III [Aequorivita sublithincola DSM 14238]|uniref:Exodeoxyribonuclease III n=1 Tax=Aequorivita sublithincola (strain DSM 14238 / LMG 21431 / ACAM 643 / 9-3) TaxID=746697 RepID=I3YRW8_AEQSU|nr:exodeoxyribonuclease III [Aequorivita sublithincola]AFL79736.1 exodeoxyribonuclease III [Aequorivita sublithincola DSM 14238]
MKIISWNVNGVRAITKKDFFDDISKMDPDVLCLQETKAQNEEVEEALSEMTDYHQYYNSAERKGYSGVAILSKKEPISVTYDMGIAEHDTEGRVICAEYDTFYLVNVYVPNSGQKLERLDYRKGWDTDFHNYLKNIEKTKSVILCGDLNVAHQAIDLKNDKANYNKTAGYTQIEIDGMDNFLNEGFVDTFRHFHPETVAYTYWSYRFKSRERNTGWRIDYFLVSNPLVEKVNKVEILSEYFGSDHCPIKLEIGI